MVAVPCARYCEETSPPSYDYVKKLDSAPTPPAYKDTKKIYCYEEMGDGTIKVTLNDTAIAIMHKNDEIAADRASLCCNIAVGITYCATVGAILAVG